VIDIGAAGAAGASLCREVLVGVKREKVGAAVMGSGAAGAAGASFPQGALAGLTSEKSGAAVVGSGAARVTRKKVGAALADNEGGHDWEEIKVAAQVPLKIPLLGSAAAVIRLWRSYGMCTP
jgi:hypothetical protein